MHSFFIGYSAEVLIQNKTLRIVVYVNLGVIMIRVFPRKTNLTPDDDLTFIGDAPLFRPKEMPVRVSCTFTWDIMEAERLKRSWQSFYSDVTIGGPAFGDSGGEFEPGMFLKPGVTITSRGCPYRCKHCFVPKREGNLRELKIKPGWIINDNNLLACSFKHQVKVFKMLNRQKRAAIFIGGLDARLFKDWHVSAFEEMRINEMFFACDNDGSIKNIERIADMLSGFSMNKKRCYVMIGMDETRKQALRRLKRVYNLGFLPFAQLYQPKERKLYNWKWKSLARTWSRPAATKAFMASQ